MMIKILICIVSIGAFTVSFTGMQCASQHINTGVCIKGTLSWIDLDNFQILFRNPILKSFFLSFFDSPIPNDGNHFKKWI